MSFEAPVSTVVPSWGKTLATAANADEKLVLDFMTGITSGSAEKAIDIAYAPKGTYRNMPGGMAEFTGFEEVKAAINGFFSIMKMDSFEAFHVASKNGRVMTERVDRFRRGDKAYDLLVMGTFEVEDGKIAAWRDYFDIGDVEQAFGIQFR